MQARFVTAAAAAALLSGCLMAGNYHSARTLNKGESAFGTNFSFITYEFEDSSGETDRVVFPNLIPEFTAHVGLADDLEVGGRVALGSLALEADMKYRFLQQDGLHLAVAPAIGYQTAILVQGTTLRLPGILTYDLSDNFGVNLALFGATSHYSGADDDDVAQFDGTMGAAGFAAGVDLRGETFEIRPSVEWTEYFARFDGADQFDGFNTISINVHFSFIRGREKQQLDRIERKLDRALEEDEAPPPAGPPGSPPR